MKATMDGIFDVKTIWIVPVLIGLITAVRTQSMGSGITSGFVALCLYLIGAAIYRTFAKSK